MPLASYGCSVPQDVVVYWHRNIATAPQFSPEVEWCVVIALNTKNQVRGHYIVGQGSPNECTVHAREVFRAAIVAGAYSFVLAHNHPSGNPEPSWDDRKMTDRLRRVGELVQIQLHDHVVVGELGRYFSFREHGFLPEDPAFQEIPPTVLRKARQLAQGGGK